MRDIIQVFKSTKRFTKTTYTTENRKRFLEWKNTIKSSNGFIEQNNLILPLECQQNPDIKSADVLLLQDVKKCDVRSGHYQFEQPELPERFMTSHESFMLNQTPNHIAFQHIPPNKSFELFKIRKVAPETYQLEIDYKTNEQRIGIPIRENHILCSLTKYHPIRIQTNGKSDFTYSGRQERFFTEFDYILEWIDSVKKIEFRHIPKNSIVKRINLKNAKLIDERKLLK